MADPLLSPVTAAKHAGYDWKALSKGERKLVSDVVRTLNRRFDKEHQAVRWDRVLLMHRLGLIKEELRARLPSKRSDLTERMKKLRDIARGKHDLI